MNRRQMFSGILGGFGAIATVPAVEHKAERPLTALHPHCPRCGDAMMFARSWWRHEPNSGPLTPVPVVCGRCDLTLMSPAFHELP